MKRKAKIYYYSLDDFWRKEEKLRWIRENLISQIPFERIEPDAKNNWINQTDNDWDDLLPLYSKKGERIFDLCFNGIQSNRDEWVYDLDVLNLKNKVRFFIEKYNQSIKENRKDFSIKWTHSLEEYFRKNHLVEYDSNFIKSESYRPFFRMFHYCDKTLNHRLTQNHFDIWGKDLNQLNYVLNFTGIASKYFACFAVQGLINVQFLFNAVNIALYKYDGNQKHENITDWALAQFHNHYKESDGERITKEDIFYYTYAVLHSPVYRKKYEQNLKREFPRLPFYNDFSNWRDWGKELMDLHINYETVEPYDLKEIESNAAPQKKSKQQSLLTEIAETVAEVFTAKPRTKLKADKANGVVEIDTRTQLTGVPPLAWEYKLGNRSALEWILDQYKEKKPQDATIAERFNRYKFEDYKEHVIDLLKRVCTVSVRTMEIINRMPKE